MPNVIVAGSRSITDYETVTKAISDAPFDIAEVVSGCADGVDTLGEQWAETHDVPVKHFPPDEYQETAESAGMPATLVRNEKMVEYADALIAVWDGDSSGTEHTIATARRHGLPVHIHRTDMFRLDEF